MPEFTEEKKRFVNESLRPLAEKIRNALEDADDVYAHYKNNYFNGFDVDTDTVTTPGLPVVTGLEVQRMLNQISKIALGTFNWSELPAKNQVERLCVRPRIGG